MTHSTKMIGQIGFEVFGTDPPLDEEVEQARALMGSAPTTSPLDVARYLEALTAVNKDGERFNSEWARRSNPLIVSFFSATTYSPDGISDQTKWCAAFVNWCLRRAQRLRTNSASSGSFRCFSDEATIPRPGDFAVFKNPGHDEPCKGSGHVGFWVGQSGTHVDVLGGNQGNRVRVTSFARVGKDLIYLTARKAT